jgi:hypothetical protein
MRGCRGEIALGLPSGKAGLRPKTDTHRNVQY